jgi:hypothetical protein
MPENARNLSKAPQPFIEAFLPNFARKESLPTARPALDFKPGSSATLNLISSCLSLLDPDMTRPDWFSVAAAIYNATHGDPEGYTLFDEWSSGGVKYKGTSETSAIWDYFKPNNTRQANIGKLIKLAQQAGHSWDEVINAAESFDALDGEGA